MMKKTLIATTLVALSMAFASISTSAADKANPQEPTIETCSGCHNIKQLVEKTKDVKPQNPHMSPHYQDQLDCINCHIMHGPTENFCDQCHSFGFKVP